MEELSCWYALVRRDWARCPPASAIVGNCVVKIQEVERYLSRESPAYICGQPMSLGIHTIPLILSCLSTRRCALILGKGTMIAMCWYAAYRIFAAITSAHPISAGSDRHYLAAAIKTSQDTG